MATISCYYLMGEIAARCGYIINCFILNEYDESFKENVNYIIDNIEAGIKAKQKDHVSIKEMQQIKLVNELTKNIVRNAHTVKTMLNDFENASAENKVSLEFYFTELEDLTIKYFNEQNYNK